MDPLTAMPEQFAAGTTLEYSRTYPDFTTAGGWTFKLWLAGTSAAISVNGTETSAGVWDFHVDGPTSAALDPGNYRWTERATKSGGAQIVDVASGLVTVTLDLAQAGAGEALSWEERTLTLVETALTGRIPVGMESYQIAGRALSKIPIKDLKELRDQLAAAVRRVRNGGRLGRQHAVVFRPPS